MKSWIPIAFMSLGVFLTAFSNAAAQHAHDMTKGGPLKMDTKEVLVEGLRVVFQVMENREHKKMLAEMKMKEEPDKGTTHNLSVQLIEEKTLKEIMNARINMKVVAPDGKDQIKMLTADEMMKYYNAYFNLSQKGLYQIMILFKIGEKKSSAGIEYEIR